MGIVVNSIRGIMVHKEEYIIRYDVIDHYDEMKYIFLSFINGNSLVELIHLNLTSQLILSS